MKTEPDAVWPLLEERLIAAGGARFLGSGGEPGSNEDELPAGLPSDVAGLAKNPGGHAAAALHNGGFERIDQFGAEFAGVGE